LLLLGPVMLLIAAIVKLDTSGPALCVQRRVGRGGRVFRFYKFRSMFCDVDHTVAHRSYCKQYINGGSGSAEKDGQNGHYKPPANGSSITPAGHWLRKYSLDELPQLINVLKGDMSLVGPRPSMDYEIEEYADWHRLRLAVLPGITGLAQVSGRSTLAFDDIVRFDIQYIERRSLWLDLLLLLKTVPAVLLAHGAS
jgi:lipopolysaccharide/colanic/teichoic acid biosynthesis glycosyltransferase